MPPVPSAAPPTSPTVRPSSFASSIASLPSRFSSDNPLWEGPSGEGANGGITQSMIQRWLACRERCRVKYVLGLSPDDKFNHLIEYGSMWHVCEEAHAGGNNLWSAKLDEYCAGLQNRYPMDRANVEKWWNVCLVQFPEYVKYWAEHADVKNRTPLMQEGVFDVPYELPSGRVVRLRGKFDSVDLIDGGVWLQENKTKGDIDAGDIERQMSCDLQSMMYLIALHEICNGEQEDSISDHPSLLPFKDGVSIKGVRYNVVRRPLSGGKGSIRPHAGSETKEVRSKRDGRILHAAKITPAETDAAFYERLRADYLADDPAYWFFRVKCEVSKKDIETFKRETFDPLLECIAWWYDEVTNRDLASAVERYGYPSLHYRTPFGGYDALREGGFTEYDAFLNNGSVAGLRQVEKLFEELV